MYALGGQLSRQAHTVTVSALTIELGCFVASDGDLRVSSSPPPATKGALVLTDGHLCTLREQGFIAGAVNLRQIP